MVASLLLTAGSARAGWVDQATSVLIGNVTVVPRDTATATVRFDLSWNGSWRHEGNHDAIWIFFKAQAGDKSEWQPVRLAANRVLNPEGYGQEKGGTPLDFLVPGGKEGFLGVFVRRAEFALPGPVTASNVTVVLEFRANRGITAETNVNIRAFGLEMVYVPEGAFNLGSGGWQANTFFRYTDGVHNDKPYRVTSAGAIQTGRREGRLWSGTGGQPEDGGEIPAAFPNGYAAFYCMKKMITYGQYADFLNTLPAAQAGARYNKVDQVKRSGQAPDYTYSTGAEAWGHNCVDLCWADGAAFAAWAGLRPMTELEYEKASRGPMEAGWDTGDALDYPSYWGIDDMNGWRLSAECTITVGTPEGRRFRGTHGRGSACLPADWPQDDAVGMGIRGGFGPAADPSCRVGVAASATTKDRRGGWRGVRAAPREAAK